MQFMISRLKHLIDPAPSLELACAEPASCRVVDALAGDCTSPIGERLRRVESECGFGQRCTRGCEHFVPATCGFAGSERVIAGRVAQAPPTDQADNADCFHVPRDAQPDGKR